MGARNDPNPDPFARAPQPAVRNPGRVEPKTATIGSTQPQQRIRAHVKRSTSTQSIADNTFVTVTFNTNSPASTVLFDTAGMLTASNELKIPLTGKVTGAWLFHAHVTWAAAAAGFREMNILEGSTVISQTHILGSNDVMSQDAAIVVNDPAPGALYKVQVKQTSGGALDLLTGAEQTYFETIYLW